MSDYLLKLRPALRCPLHVDDGRHLGDCCIGKKLLLLLAHMLVHNLQGTTHMHMAHGSLYTLKPDSLYANWELLLQFFCHTYRSKEQQLHMPVLR